jgi:hypothetical protein
MTLSTVPTFICKDRDSVSFALKVVLPAGSSIESFDYKRFKKGFTVAVNNPRRSGVVGGKQGFIEARLSDVEVGDSLLSLLVMRGC